MWRAAPLGWSEPLQYRYWLSLRRPFEPPRRSLWPRLPSLSKEGSRKLSEAAAGSYIVQGFPGFATENN